MVWRRHTSERAVDNACNRTFADAARQHCCANGCGFDRLCLQCRRQNFDFLAEGETLTVTYNVTVTDNFGATSTQPVTITITGSEDKPVITPAVQSGLVTEDTDGAANENAETHHQSGTINFTDVDLTDVETSSITNKQLSATLANGYTLTSGQHDALVNAFTIDAATHSNVSGAGSIGWHYDILDSALDFLGKNDQVVLSTRCRSTTAMAARIPRTSPSRCMAPRTSRSSPQACSPAW